MEWEMKELDSDILGCFRDGEATKKRRNEDSISQQKKSEGQEKDERPSIKAKRAAFPVIIQNSMPKSAINITKHSPGVHGSSHSSRDTVNCHKSVADVVVLDDTSSDEDVAPLSSHVKLPVRKMSQFPAQVLDKTKAKVQKLLMMPLHEVLLPENYSVLVTALPIYAGSPNLSVEKAHALEELEKNLPSLFTNFHHAKRQEDDYFSKSAKKGILIDKLTKKQELYNDVKNHHIDIDATISKLKASLEKAEMNKRAIEEQEINLKNEISPLEAALEELGGESLISKKDMADSLTTQAEASWADCKQKIIDLGI